MRKLIRIAISLCVIMAVLVSCSGKNDEIKYSNSTTSPTVKTLSETTIITSTDPQASTASIVAAPSRSTASSMNLVSVSNISSVKGNKKMLAKTTSKKVKKTPVKKSKKKNKKASTKTPTATPVPTTDPNKQKYVALTFDDGPDKVTTPKVIDKLEKYGIVASFFMVGQNLNDDFIPVLQREIALGCELDNHSWSHPSSMKSMEVADIKKEFQSTSDKIFEMVGVYPKFFRPPFSSANERMYDAIDVPFINGLTCNDWSADMSPKERAQRIFDYVQDGDIILMHDSLGNDKTVKALDIIIPELLDRGYQFVTVSQLFEKEGVDPNKEYHLWNNVFK